MIVFRYSLLLLLAVILSGLTSCSAGKKTSTENWEVEIMPGWTNQGSLDIADEFAGQLDLTKIRDSKPVFLIGKIEAVRAAEEMVSNLEYDIEFTLVNTGMVSFIKDKKVRDYERENRKNMSSFETEAKFYSYYNKLNVDKFVEGKIIGNITTDNVSSYIIALYVIDIKKKEISGWQKDVKRP